MSEWQDISTAPKDGSIIKVRHHDFAPFHAFWKNNQWYPIEYVRGEPTHWLRRAAEEEV